MTNSFFLNLAFIAFWKRALQILSCKSQFKYELHVLRVSLCEGMNGRDTRFLFTNVTYTEVRVALAVISAPADILLRLNINRYWSISRFDLSVMTYF